jgi:hypothetical protein
LDFCCEEEKVRRLSERREFASSPSLRQKFKEGVAISARLSLPTFFGKTKKVSQPRQGMKQEMHHKSPPQQKQRNKGCTTTP